jgi:putative ABC transport system ATP-binding protein
MITLKHVSKIYRTTEVETTALSDLNLDIPKGQFIAVMGPSGSGKSTFLNIVGMLDSPSAGEYWFDGHNIVSYSQTQLAQLRKHALGFVFQSFNLIDELNVLENVELALLYHDDVSARERRKRANEALDRMKISHRKHHMPSQLSGGRRQRRHRPCVVARPK